MLVNNNSGRNRCVWFLFVFLLGFCGEVTASLSEKIEPMEGISIDAYSFQDEASVKIAGSTLKGRPTLIHFWATFCAPCLDELKVIKRSVLGRNDFSFYSICINKKKTEEIAAFYKNTDWKGFPFIKIWITRSYVCFKIKECLPHIL